MHLGSHCVLAGGRFVCFPCSVGFCQYSLRRVLTPCPARAENRTEIFVSVQEGGIELSGIVLSVGALGMDWACWQNG